MSDILYRKQKKYYFLLVLPALCIYTFALAGPLIFGTIPNSFFSWNLIKGTHNWIGIKNFVDLVHDRDFIQSMFLTFKLALVREFNGSICGGISGYRVAGPGIFDDPLHHRFAVDSS